jgi:hypothetical protein
VEGPNDDLGNFEPKYVATNEPIFNGESIQNQYKQRRKSIPIQNANQSDAAENTTINPPVKKRGGFQKGWKGGTGGAREGAGRKPKSMHERLAELNEHLTINTRRTIERLAKIATEGQSKDAIAASELLLRYTLPIPKDPQESVSTTNVNIVNVSQSSEAQKLLDSRRKARLAIEAKQTESTASPLSGSPEGPVVEI